VNPPVPHGAPRGVGTSLMGAARAGAALMGALAGVVLLWPGTAQAQALDLRGYYLHALAGLERSPYSDGGVLDVQRIRFMTTPRWGSMELNVAYEHTLTLRTDDLVLGRGFEGMETATPWLDLQGTFVHRRRVTWAHGLDRLSVSRTVGDRVRVTVGRQSISWATALYFTPADPFVPFDPTDPFREYRGGVDALRAVVFLGPFSELEGVVRPATTADGQETLTAAVRGQTLLRGWDLSGWAGTVHDDPSAAVAAAGSLGGFGLRIEGGVRRAPGASILRLAVGTDRLFEVFERDLRTVLEVQHDGFGAGRAAELLDVALSGPARRGELTVLGKDAVMLIASYQVHPLTSVDLLSLVNPRDGSALLAPAVIRSLTDEASIRLGAFVGLGPGSGGLSLRSEHGATPLVGYAAASIFF
jgi:hypothetical protein